MNENGVGDSTAKVVNSEQITTRSPLAASAHLVGDSTAKVVNSEQITTRPPAYTGA